MARQPAGLKTPARLCHESVHPMLKLLAFVLPLGLDSFAVAAAIGAARQTTWRERLRISATFMTFEAGMPLIGVLLGHALAHGIGRIADYLAAAAVIGIGAWMAFSGDSDDEEEKAARIPSSHGMALIGLGLSISLDELAIGFSAGLIQLPVVAVIVAIALQALIAAQLGLATGTRIGERLRDRAEQVAGIALILLGIYLITSLLGR